MWCSGITLLTHNPSDAMMFNGMKELRRDYFHHSARDQEERDTHRDATDFAEWAGNDSNYKEVGKPKREVYTNISSKAILPTQNEDA